MLYIGGFVQSFVHNAFDYDGQNYVVKMQCNRKMLLRILSQRCFLPFLSIRDNIFLPAYLLSLSHCSAHCVCSFVSRAVYIMPYGVVVFLQ